MELNFFSPPLRKYKTRSQLEEISPHQILPPPVSDLNLNPPNPPRWSIDTIDSLCLIRTDDFSIVPRFKSTSEGSPKPVLAPLLLPNSYLSPTLMADLRRHPLCSSLHQPTVLVHPSYILKTSERGLQIAYFLSQFMRSRHGYRTKAERLRVPKRLHVESRTPLSKRSALCLSIIQFTTFSPLDQSSLERQS